MPAETEVRIFRELEHPLTIAELASRVSSSRSAASRAVSSLRNSGLVDPRGRRPVRRASTLHARALAQLMGRYPRQQWESHLSGASLHLLALLAVPRTGDWPHRAVEGPPAFAEFSFKPRSVQELSEMSGLSRPYVHVRIVGLGRAGVLGRRRGLCWLSPLHQELAEFARLWWRSENERTRLALAPESGVLWQRGPEFLVRTATEVDHPSLRPAGPSVMGEFGLPLVSADHYYLHTRRELQAADHVILTLLCEPGSHAFISYACLLYAKARPRDLVRCARRYDVTLPGEALERYVVTKGAEAPAAMPAWRDFARMARMYEVEV